MKIKIAFLITLVLIFSCCRLTAFAQTGKEYKLVNQGKNSIGDKLHVFLKFDSIQYHYQTGIRFSLRFKNSSKDSITIGNPIHLLNLVLLNDSGRSVLFPYISPIYTRASQTFETFSIESTMLNGESVNTDLSSVRTITIPGKGNFGIDFKITDMLKPGSSKPYTSSQKMKIANGRYTLILSQGIQEGNKAEAYDVRPVTLLYTLCH